jgi:hypothetical protein
MKTIQITFDRENDEVKITPPNGVSIDEIVAGLAVEKGYRETTRKSENIEPETISGAVAAQARYDELRESGARVNMSSVGDDEFQISGTREIEVPNPETRDDFLAKIYGNYFSEEFYRGVEKIAAKQAREKFAAKLAA